MNIFVLHRNPIISAQLHCDQHVVKMIIESAQLLYTCLLTVGIVGDINHDRITTAPISKSNTYGYKATHKNHPCAKWVRQSVGNYEWLYLMAKELCNEYRRRFNKVHKTEEHIEWLGYVCPNISLNKITTFALAMPAQYKVDDIVTSYHNYYKSKTFARWKMGIPKFIQ